MDVKFASTTKLAEPSIFFVNKHYGSSNMEFALFLHVDCVFR
jgi:hypothetical protein